MTYLLFLLFISRNPTNYSCNINNRSSISVWERSVLCLELIEKNVDIRNSSTTRKHCSTPYSIYYISREREEEKPQDVFSKNKPKWIKYFRQQQPFMQWVSEIPHTDLNTKHFLIRNLKNFFLFIDCLSPTPLSNRNKSHLNIVYSNEINSTQNVNEWNSFIVLCSRI